MSEPAASTSVEDLEILLEALPTGAVLCDERGSILWINTVAGKMLGYAPAELIGQPVEVLLPQALRARHESYRAQFLESPVPREMGARIDLVALRKDGSHCPVQIGLKPVRTVDGTAVLAILVDLTERKAMELALLESEVRFRQLNAELEQRVIQRTAELEAVNAELEAFTYSVSHDLRAPLRTVSGFSEALSEDFGPQLPAEGKRFLQLIRLGAQRMSELIDDLLAFSRLGRQPMMKRQVEMSLLLREVIEDLGPMIQGRAVELNIGELPPCEGDPALLKQVWSNLLANAFKYTRGRASAVVEIGCVQAPGTNAYFVRDNGAGFDMRYADKLFGVFQRMHAASEFEGTGVGLAIVQRIVLRHGGRVWAEAAVDRGATFHFTLEPAAAA